MKTTENLHQIIAGALSIAPENVSDTLEYQGIPEWDSMSHLDLVSQLEETYKVKIGMEDVLEMGSVAKIKDTLKKYGAQIV